MERNSRTTETAFKKKELERLLGEGKITLEQYLDARVEIENLKASQNSDQSSRSRQTVAHDESTQSMNGEVAKKSYTKMILGVVLCSIILIGGFFAWSYLNPVYAESLTIESYSFKLFTKGAILFELKNTGNTDIRISNVKMNGYLNQSIENWNQGWNGTEFLRSDQTGTIYVHIFCYFYILNASMPHLSSPPSQTEMENFYSWIESYNCTFTFVTNTQHEYNCTVPGLTSFASMIIPAWMGALTYTFIGTEQLQIKNIEFLSNDRINITMQNAGITLITITEIWVNNVKAWNEGNIIIPGYQKTVTLDIAWVTGDNYQFKVVTSMGNQFHYTAVAPSTHVQEEALFLTKQHVWYNTSGSWAQAAIVIVNTGGKDVVLDKISVRGQECPWTNVYYWRTNSVTISDDLRVTSSPLTGPSVNITVQGTPRNFTQALGDLTLISGYTMVVYVMNPDSIALNDVGITVGITVFTSNAQYYKEMNVEVATASERAHEEFIDMKQFMQTVGLQIDDVAWTIGRTQTVRYTCNFGFVDFEALTLNYTIYVDKGEGYVYFASYSVGILLFNMPTSEYSLGNNYYEPIFPSSDSSFLQKGTSAPVSHVYIIEKVPMNDGNFIRVVLAPSIRMLNSTISTGGQEKNYFRFYLPILSSGTHLRHSQSVTLAGSAVSVNTESDITKVKIQVSFPKNSLGLDEDFFNFDSVEEEVDVPDGSIIEFYTGEVIVSIGLYI